jgi:6-phosphogluconolactonase
MRDDRPPRILVRRFTARGELDAALASRIVDACQHVHDRAAALVLLSGGGTPLPAYALAVERSPAAHPDLRIAYTDERHVPAESEASNYRSTKPLIDSLRLPAQRVLRVRTELPVQDAARDYEERLAKAAHDGFGIGFGLFGLGADGHTASLFSTADLERGEGRLAIAVQRPDGRAAVSVTPALIAKVSEPLIVVAGADKQWALASFLRRESTLVAWRAFSGCKRVEVWADAAAYPQERVQL